MASRKSQQNSAASVIDGYEPLDVIGRGTFGLIRRVRRRADGQIFARKELDFNRMSDRDRRQIVAEVNILRNLQHASIVAYVERFVDQPNGILYIIMEYCEGGDLGAKIKECRKSNALLPEDMVWSYLAQMAQALEACHYRAPDGAASNEADTSHAILHRDLKPENVFLDGQGCIKLGDFGLSKQVAAQTFASTYVGTPYYMSPQVACGIPYDCKSDVWALGCIAYELCAWAPPFDATTQAELTRKIKQGHVPQLPPLYSAELGNCIRALLSLEPRNRPTTRELLQRPRVAFAAKAHELTLMQKTLSARQAAFSIREAELAARFEQVQEREEALAAQAEQGGAQHAEELQRREEAVTARERECEWREQQIHTWCEQQQLAQQDQQQQQHLQPPPPRSQVLTASSSSTEAPPQITRLASRTSRLSTAASTTSLTAGGSAEERAVRRAERAAARLAPVPAARPSMRRGSSGGRITASASSTLASDESVDSNGAGGAGGYSRIAATRSPRASRERQLALAIRLREREEVKEAKRVAAEAAGSGTAYAARRREDSGASSEEWVEEDVSPALHATARALPTHDSQDNVEASAPIAPAARAPRQSALLNPAARAARMWRANAPSAGDDSDVSMRDASMSSSPSATTLAQHQLKLQQAQRRSNDDAGADKENKEVMELAQSVGGMTIAQKSSPVATTTTTGAMERPALNTRTTIAAVPQAGRLAELSGGGGAAAPFGALADDDPDLPSPFIRKVTRIPNEKLKLGTAGSSASKLLSRAVTAGASKAAAAAKLSSDPAHVASASAPLRPLIPRAESAGRVPARRMSAVPLATATPLLPAAAGAPAGRIGRPRASHALVGSAAALPVIPGAAPRRSWMPSRERT